MKLLKPIRDTFLAAIQRTPMRDWAALRAQAKAEAPARGYEGQSGPAIALRAILREERTKRKAARLRARAARPRLVIVTTSKRCAAPGCKRSPELHGKPMCGPHWYRVPGFLRRRILSGPVLGQDLYAAKMHATGEVLP